MSMLHLHTMKIKPLPSSYDMARRRTMFLKYLNNNKGLVLCILGGSRHKVNRQMKLTYNEYEKCKYHRAIPIVISKINRIVNPYNSVHRPKIPKDAKTFLNCKYKLNFATMNKVIEIWTANIFCQNWRRFF